MNLRIASISFLCLGHLVVALAAANSAPLPGIKVSANHRFLVAETGTPFFYLGDTAWALFSRLNREEAATYLAKRSAQGFTVVQAALTFRSTNAYGKTPFLESDPAHPAITPGGDPASPEQYDFWDHQQMKHLKQLLLSRSYLERVPDQQLLVEPFVVADHVSAARGRDYAFFYASTGKPFTVRMGKISGTKVKAQWYDPRTGACSTAGVFPNSGSQCFTPPTTGAEMDWVLVLDDAAKESPVPGRPNLNQ